MISKLSEKAVDALLSHGDLPQEDRELYVYGFFMLFSKSFFFLLTFIYGALLGNIMESIIFYIMFTVIRGYAGGVHASKESTCTICTSLSLLLFVAGMRLCKDLSLVIAPLLFLLFSATCIFIMSPLDTEAKRLTKEEKKEYGKKSNVFTILILTAALSTLALGKTGMLYPSAAALTFESTLLISGKIISIFRADQNN